MYRSRKHTKAYNPKSYRKNLERGKIKCPFCNLEEQRVIRDSKNMYVIDNIYPYDYWEAGMKVSDHIMIIPKRHIKSFKEFNADEKAEFLDLVTEYDIKGYNTYTRTVKNQEKSVEHHHTHLIKVGDEPAKLYFYLKKPYLIFRK